MNVALDIGNVLCKVDLAPFIERVGQLFGWEERRVYALCNAAAHDIGLTDIVADFRNEFNVNSVWISQQQLDELHGAWSKCVYPVPEMVALLEELTAMGRVALLSNIGTDHTKLIRDTFPPVFNKCIQHFSCEVGVRKPGKLFFQSFLLDEEDFYGCVYVDDKIENVLAAEKSGFRAVQFDLDSFKNDSNSAALQLRSIILDSR